MESKLALDELIKERDNASQSLQEVINNYNNKIADYYKQSCNPERILNKLICYSIYNNHSQESWYTLMAHNNNNSQKAIETLFDHKNNNVIKLRFAVPTSVKFLEFNKCFEYRGKCLDIILTLNNEKDEYYCSYLYFDEAYSEKVYYSCKESDKSIDYYINCNDNILILLNKVLYELKDNGLGIVSNLINKLYRND